METNKEKGRKAGTWAFATHFLFPSPQPPQAFFFPSPHASTFGQGSTKEASVNERFHVPCDLQFMELEVVHVAYIPPFVFIGYKNSQEVAYIKHAEKMKHQRQKALGEAPLEPTYELNPRIKQNLEMFQQTFQSNNAQANQPDNEPGTPGQQVLKDPEFKPKRVKFNQEIFSGAMHRKVKKERENKRDKLRNRPATM